jgi:hypothetical protein
MKLSIKAGSTSQSITVFILDATSGTGAGLTGLVYNSAGLTARYTHSGTYATSTAITLATLAAITSSWSSGGFKEVDAATMPGMYRFDIPNACVQDSKGQSVVLMLYGAANMVPVTIEIEIRGVSFGAVDANVTQIDGQATSGNNATLKLKSLDIQSNDTSVSAIEIRGANGGAGLGGGKAVNVLGGSAGTGGATGADAIYVKGGGGTTTRGFGLNLDAAVGGTGLNVSGNLASAAIFSGYNGSDIRANIVGSVSGSVHGVTTLRPVINTGYSNFMFPMFDASTKSPKSGLSVTAERAIDGNPFSSCSNAVAELGNGVYRINLSASDMNGDKIMFRFTATGADDQLIEVFTQG